MFNPTPTPTPPLPTRKAGEESPEKRMRGRGREKGGGVGRAGGKAERIHAFYIQMAQKNDCPPHSRLNTADPGEEKRPSLSKDQFGNRSQNLWPRTPPSGPSWGMSSERLTQICSQKLYLQEGRILHKDPQQRIGQLDYSKIVGRSAIKLAKVILWGRRI